LHTGNGVSHVRVCMYACACACTCVRVRACACLRVRVCICVSASACMRVHVSVKAHCAPASANDLQVAVVAGVMQRRVPVVVLVVNARA